MGTPQVNPLLSYTMENLQLCINRTSHFMCSNSLQVMKIWEWANSEAWIWAWVAAKLVSVPDLLYPQHQG